MDVYFTKTWDRGAPAPPEYCLIFHTWRSWSSAVPAKFNLLSYLSSENTLSLPTQKRKEPFFLILGNAINMDLAHSAVIDLSIIVREQVLNFIAIITI